MTLKWSANCVITNKGYREGDPDADPAVAGINSPTNAVFSITDTKLYVPVVTLSTEDDGKFIQKLKTGFKRTVKWNKYRSDKSNQTKNSNLNYLLDPTFNKVNRLFALSFEKEDNRFSNSKYYTSTVEIKDYNVLIDGKSFFDISIKNIEEAYEKNCRNEQTGFTTGNLLDYVYFSKQ